MTKYIRKLLARIVARFNKKKSDESDSELKYPLF
jgi:hypothetical protein